MAPVAFEVAYVLPCGQYWNSTGLHRFVLSLANGLVAVSYDLSIFTVMDTKRGSGARKVKGDHYLVFQSTVNFEKGRCRMGGHF